ncbi:hypothetical protein C8034_v005212 [Colletotrichum sidae]|uniref:Uncharacterized protein n=3 Tax=Colletotrichum orbiculare species complex TaxID=2707354 RepID=N4W0Y5_COLOR|nr:hypothetical protein Cob_v000711 [Colletotrichum orbiculare MAFF 240422]TDZ73198.1 hypothetical protein CTRI78_v001388 [Colletotrichum trifolii]TEA22805.1 hypothetical protein C8034_v005212 [Colletotrichum sidae]
MSPKGLRRVASEFSLRMSPPRRMFSDESIQSQTSDYSASNVSVTGGPTKPKHQSSSKSKKSKPHWMNQIKDWFSTGEPSSQDWKKFKQNEFHKHGILMNDPEASAKLHAPIGAIPEEAIKPSSGPDPEALARKRAVNRKQLRHGHSNSERAMSSISSESSSGSRVPKDIAPWV